MKTIPRADRVFPSFLALRAFEAAAWSGGFTDAGQGVNLPPRQSGIRCGRSIGCYTTPAKDDETDVVERCCELETGSFSIGCGRDGVRR